jgi:hypothetical protein
LTFQIFYVFWLSKLLLKNIFPPLNFSKKFSSFAPLRVFEKVSYFLEEANFSTEPKIIFYRIGLNSTKMGSVCMKSVDDDDYGDGYGHNYGSFRTHNHNQAPDQKMHTVAMLASMAHQTGGLLNQMAQAAEFMDAMEFQERVRKAKAEDRTVTIRNDCLYIDYEFVGRAPPNLSAYY